MQLRDYRQILIRELEIRKQRNSNYNLSSFARLLRIPPSRLSEILRRKAGLSTARASAIAQTLRLSHEERSYFLDLVCIEHGRSPTEREKAKKRLDKASDFFRFEEEQFAMIADFHHHAIVELIGLSETITFKEISKALRIDVTQVTISINRLLMLQIIIKTPKGYKVSTQNRGTKNDIPSEAIKRLHEQYLLKAKEEIRLQDVHNRDYSIVFFNFNKNQLETAKERIKTFRRSFMSEFENSTDKDSVYCMGVQFFEITEPSSKK